jgi:hypothetical protein
MAPNHLALQTNRLVLLGLAFDVDATLLCNFDGPGYTALQLACPYFLESLFLGISDITIIETAAVCLDLT